MTHRRRRLATAASGVAMLALIASAASTNAQPAALPDEPVPTVGPGTPVLAGARDDVREGLEGVAGGAVGVPLTLITGDNLVIGLDGDGVPVVHETVAAPRDDGSQPVFYTVTRADRTYVVPSDALSLVEADVLDWGLFDVAALAELAGAGVVDEVPVIVTYQNAATARHAPAEVAGATVERTFTSIAASALTVEGDGQWWQQASAAQDASPTGDPAATATASGPLAGVEKVWLDGLAEIHLEESVPQVEAPAAWDAGFDGTGVTVAVLDTGIDANHPDVTGKIVDAVDFTGTSADAIDGHGHGTHVAATVAGSGAASDGLRPGVAPGADVLVGKVCNDEGRCETSQVMAGMEWAASSGAQVVNMSLGGDPTDGTDPESLLLNELSARYDTLFVVSAGNDGPGASTVTYPAAADAALAVAAVDKDDQMASFSSRGPRAGDGALKPEIAAPGVGIVAARAAGTSMGSVVDEHYTASNGTSMAAPHVAGGAAIVAQQNPEMSAESLKALLMGTAVDLGHDLYAQGAGRMDLDRAGEATVFAAAPVAFGALPYPQQEPETMQARFVNVTAEPVTLSLEAEFTDGAGNPAPDGVFTVGADEVTVPAHGDVAVDITLDAAVVADGGGLYGQYGGRVTAYDDTGAQRADALVSAFLEEERFPVDITIAGVEGRPGARYETVLIVPMDARTDLHDGTITAPGGKHVTADLFEGTYAIGFTVRWLDDDSNVQSAFLMAPEVVVAGDTSVTLDLADAQRFAVDSQEPLNVVDAKTDVQRTSATGEWGLTATLKFSPSTQTEPRSWLLPTDPVEEGTLTVATGAVMIPDMTPLRALGGGRAFDLDARYVTDDVSLTGSIHMWPEGDTTGVRRAVHPVPRLVSTRPLPVVHAGTGTADELSAVDVAGKLVLLTPTDICGERCPYDALNDRVEAAAELGAVGTLIGGSDQRPSLRSPAERLIELCADGPESCPPVRPFSSIPVLTVSVDDAATLIDRLAVRNNVRIAVGGDGAVSEVYALPFLDDQVPAMPYQVDTTTLHQTTHRIHDSRPGETNIPFWTRVVGDSAVTMTLPRMGTPTEFALYVPERPADGADELYVPLQKFTAPNAAEYDLDRAYISWNPGERRLLTPDDLSSTYAWNTGPQVPGPATTTISTVDRTVTPGVCSGCREGDTFWPTIHLTTSSGDPTTAVTGLENDIGNGAWYLNSNGCDDCELTLSDETGETLSPSVLPPTAGVSAYTGDFIAFEDLSAEGSRYTLELDNGDATTVWEYDSGHVDESSAVGRCTGAVVLEAEPGECRPEGLIFLRYDLGLDLDESVPAGPHTITVTAYHEGRLAGAPEVTDLTTEVSHDDGATWAPARGHAAGDNTFEVTAEHPRDAGAVSLRVTAADSDGNTVVQTLPEAFTVR